MFALAISLVGLIIGSFLNVIVYRLPLMMRENNQSINLFLPRSHCPRCRHTISWWENIPLLSYLILKGKCAYCKQIISLRYPLLEICSAIISVVIAYYFGWSWQIIPALILSWSLLALTFIDIEQQLLPDIITLPLLWLGLLLSITGVFTDTASAILGAVAGYLVLWIIGWLFQRITKKTGIGYGDYKLLALLGAWLGWQMLPFILLLASLLGSIVGLILIAIKKQTRDVPIAFGPFLAFSGWLALLYGSKINGFWFSLVGG